MKKMIVYLIFLVGLIVSGCAKKPYQNYKTSYKTEKAELFYDKGVTPEEAVKKNIKHMTLPEVRAARIYYEKTDETELIEKVLNHIIKISDNYQEKADCLYELATIQLAEGRLEKARELFEQLIREYPGVDCKKEAGYRLILAYYWDCSDAQHDQEMTEKTLQLIESFQQEFPSEMKYQEHLEEIQHICNKLLFDAEILRMNFYISKYEITGELEPLTSAKRRLGHILGKLIESQKQFSSDTKDALLDLYLSLEELSPEEKDKKYKTIIDARNMLESHAH